MRDRYSAAIAKHLVAVVLSGILAFSVPASAAGVVIPSDHIGGLPVSSLDTQVASRAPDIVAPAGVLVAPDGRLLWSRAPDERRAMASTTKIMTALVVLERADLDESVTVSARATSTGEAAARLVPGGTYPARTLLEAMLVRSGNDVAMALAEHVAGDVPTFVEMMNERARSMGLENTQFANPHGLDGEGHYTSAQDLATMARIAMGDPVFREFVARDSLVIDAVGGASELENNNLLLGNLEGATGVKTGWTSRAGYCLVASAERAGHELVAVVLGTPDEATRFREAGVLLEWGFAHYRDERLVETGESAGRVVVSDYLDIDVEAVVAAPVIVPVFDLDGEVVRKAILPDAVDAPVRAGDRLGTLSLVQGERLIAQVPLIAAEDVRRPSVLKRLQIAVTRAWRSAFSDSAPEGVPAIP